MPVSPGTSSVVMVQSGAAVVVVSWTVSGTVDVVDDVVVVELVVDVVDDVDDVVEAGPVVDVGAPVEGATGEDEGVTVEVASETGEVVAVEPAVVVEPGVAVVVEPPTETLPFAPPTLVTGVLERPEGTSTKSSPTATWTGSATGSDGSMAGCRSTTPDPAVSNPAGNEPVIRSAAEAVSLNHGLWASPG